ncbi:MAG: SDR family NAD(P)-dependent oxidoreductase [Gammaproteobacteria bacterium]|nr:SDR family NAD(P)-dependent oxidoreductase [Gammaproteobacteria bacterium]
MSGELENRVAIVTGSSRGIGEAIARRLALAGATVVVTARTVEVRDERLAGTVHTVAEAIEGLGGKALAVACNMMKGEDRARLVETVLAELGRVDILVNNAAILVPGGTIDFDERYYDRMFEILVKAPHHLCQLILPNMIEHASGSVLNISSRGALHPAKPYSGSYGGSVYGMTKAAIERFTTGLAAEMYEHNISVNALSPNLVVPTPGQMFGRDYTQEMLDASERVEVMAEAAFLLVSGDPKEQTGGICYSQDLLDERGASPLDIGMKAPVPNA